MSDDRAAEARHKRLNRMRDITPPLGHTPRTKSYWEHEQDKLDFPRFCATPCGKVLYKRADAQRVKYTNMGTGESWYDWACSPSRWLTERAIKGASQWQQ